MSTSSSECGCDRLQYCGARTQQMESPWYPTIGQPLIYYSQVEHPLRWRQRVTETRNDKPNCFKKAFRWYTQDHVPFMNECVDSPSIRNKNEVRNFAAWLDDKYNEFLLTSQVERTKYLLTQNSAIEIDQSTNSTQSKQQRTKKYKRVKSPWKKRYKKLNATEKGDIFMQSNQSVEIILKPKDLSRSASECCQRPKAQSCCNRSNTTVESIESMHGVVKHKSQSLSAVKEKEIHMIPFDIPDYAAQKNLMERKFNKSSFQNNEKKDSKKKKKLSSRPVSCQCSKYTRVHDKVDVYSQVEDKRVNGTDNNNCPCKMSSTADVKIPLDNPIVETEIISLESKTCGTNENPNTDPEYILQIEETRFSTPITNAEKERKFIESVSDSVQTSDCAINLISNRFPEYPLFMKIICADKLKAN